MRKKLIFSIFIALIFLIIYVINMLPKEEVQAASSGSNSDIQLLAACTSSFGNEFTI